MYWMDCLNWPENLPTLWFVVSYMRIYYANFHVPDSNTFYCSSKEGGTM